MLAKLRCSNHCLLIETGRHNNADVSDRKCTPYHVPKTSPKTYYHVTSTTKTTRIQPWNVVRH